MHEIVYTAQLIEPCTEKGRLDFHQPPIRWRLIRAGDHRKPSPLITSVETKPLSAWFSRFEFSFFTSSYVSPFYVSPFQFQLFIRVHTPSYLEIWLLDTLLKSIDERVSRMLRSLERVSSLFVHEGNGANEEG